MRLALSLVISIMPLLAETPQGSLTAMVSNASVLFGPGIVEDKSGETPAPRFETKLRGEIQLKGMNSRTKLRFRFWLMKARDEEKVKRASPGSLKAKILSANAGVKIDGGYSFESRWFKSSVDPDDRLFVEVFQGRRRVATAISPIQANYLPVSRPREKEGHN